MPMDDQVGRPDWRPESRPELRADMPQTMPRAPASSPPRTRGRAPWRVLLVLLAIVGAGALVYLHPWSRGAPSGGRTGRPNPADIPQPVREATVTAGDIPVTLNALGTVTPLATVTVKTQIAGQLVTIAFKEGQLVAKGDFLAQIDSRPYQIQLEQAQGQLGHDQALLKNAQTDLARYQKLSAQDSIARQQVDTQSSLVQQYAGTVQADQAQVDSAKLNLAYCHIVAPTDGRVGLRQVDQGNYVQTGDANGLVVVTQLQPISVLFTLPEDNLPAVLKRMAAGATLPVTAYDRANVAKLAAGHLETTDNQIDTTTGTVKLRALFANADTALFPNQFVNARMLVDTIHDAMVAPTAAIQTGAPGSFVYLAKDDGTVTVRPVKVGATDGERVQILSGLALGDKVVIDGADRLKEGAKITVPAPSAAMPSGESGPDAGAPGAATHRHHPTAAPAAAP